MTHMEICIRSIRAEAILKSCGKHNSHRGESDVFIGCCRWLDRNEDDGQIVRELVPFADGPRLYSKYFTDCYEKAQL